MRPWKPDPEQVIVAFGVAVWLLAFVVCLLLSLSDPERRLP